MRLKIFIATIIFCSFAYSDLVDHLKKAPNKGSDHNMRNIDFIYMINLDKRPEKYALSLSYLKPYGINPYRFSAVNGWSLSKQTIQEVGVKYQLGMTPLMATVYPPEIEAKIPSYEFMKVPGRTYFGHCLTLGAIGCAMSHISILKDAYDSGYETIWVMEDDIEVLEDPNILSSLIEELDEVVGHDNWDVLFTDYDYRVGVGVYLPASGAQKRPDMDCTLEERYSDKYTKKIKINDHFYTVAARFGTASMIIRRSGIKKLLDFALTRNIFLPYDLENYLAKDIHRYGLSYDVVTNLLNSISDIACEGMPQQEKAR